MDYLTVVEADAIIARLLEREAWDYATEEDKTAALAQATDIINDQAYVGDKTVEGQDNAFPRGGDTTVSTDVTRACAYIAYALLDLIDPEAEYQKLHVDKETYAKVSTAYNRDTTPEFAAVGIPSPKAYALLRPYMVDMSSFKLSRVS